MTDLPPIPTEAAMKAAIRSSKQKGRALRAFKARPPEPDAHLSEFEAVSQKAVDLLLAHPMVGFAWKQPAGQFKTRKGKGKPVTIAPGLPDVLGWLLDGKFFAFEGKKRGVSSLSQAQKDIQHRLARCNVIRGIIETAEQAVELVEASRR